MDLSNAQQISVRTYKVVGLSGDCAFEELIVGRVTAPLDRRRPTHEKSLPMKQGYQSASFDGAQAELLEDLGSLEDTLDLFRDRFGKDQGEPAVAPGIVDAGSEALGLGDSASEENLGVKNDSGRGQLGGLHRSP